MINIQNAWELIRFFAANAESQYSTQLISENGNIFWLILYDIAKSKAKYCGMSIVVHEA
jgi:hypothetical protein